MPVKICCGTAVRQRLTVRTSLHEVRSTTMFFKEKRADLIQQNNRQTHDNEARDDFWSTFENYIYGHHVQPRVKLYVSNGGQFPFSLKSLDVVRRTSTAMDVLLESRRDDSWNVDGGQMLPVPWTSFIQFSMLNEKPPNGYTWPWERSTKCRQHPGPSIYGQKCGPTYRKSSEEKRKTALGNRKVEARQCSKIERNLIHRCG